MAFAVLHKEDVVLRPKPTLAPSADLNTVLICGDYRIGDLIDLTNLRTTFLFKIGAGASALLLRKNWPENHILGSHLITDGSLSRHVVVPASGTVQFPTAVARSQGFFNFDLVEPEAMKTRLNQGSMDNWMRCIDEALRKRGYSHSDLCILNMALIKPSGFRDMLSLLGLSEEQSVSNARIGHVGEQDSTINSLEGLRQGRLKDGDLLAIGRAGIGYVRGDLCAVGNPQMILGETRTENNTVFWQRIGNIPQQAMDFISDPHNKSI